MSDLRQLLRYELPGLFFIFETLFLLICFIDYIEIQTIIYSFLPNIDYKAVVLLLPIVALPIGWFIYQVYDMVHEPYYKAIDMPKLQNLIKIKLPKGKRARKESYYEELIDFIILNEKNKEIAQSFPHYWENYDARYIIGLLPIASIIFLVPEYGIFHNYFSIPQAYRIVLLFLFLVLFIISVKIHISARRILDEIQAREEFLIIESKNIIDAGINNNPELIKWFDP